MRSCECLDAWVGPVRVTVANGAVTRVYTGSGAPVAASNVHLFPTVEGLFAIIENANNQRVARLIVRYDSLRGFPVEVALDERAVHVDDEVTYYARDFVAH